MIIKNIVVYVKKDTTCPNSYLFTMPSLTQGYIWGTQLGSNSLINNQISMPITTPRRGTLYFFNF